jgi:3-hydroxyisobutyrate dehydrogenase-like beta-hydroxyacid dehydrogenase
MPKKSRKNVGLIGLGIIGSRVANALRLGGFHVYVWNRTPRAAPNFLASPHQVAELCDVIQIFVADAQALFSVLDSMTSALTPSHLILCNSTVGPEATLDAARLVQEAGAQFLDAPFTGSKAAAEKRELVYYIGGDDKTLQTAEPVLKASSKAIVKIGKIGDAAIVKVATNMLAAVTVQTLAEAYAIVKGSGIDPRALVEALKNHGVRSDAIDAKLAKILDRDYEPHFSLKHMFKDVQLGIHIANSLDIDLPATTSTAGVMYGGLTRGWSDEDFSVLARSYQTENQPLPLYTPPSPKPLEKTPPAPAPADTNPPAPSQPAGAPGAPAPSVPKREPEAGTGVEELLGAGVKIPDSPAPPVPPAAEKTAPQAPVAPPALKESPQSPDGATAPAPIAVKREPIREPTVEELRDAGIKIPAPAAPPVLEKIAAPPPADTPKLEPPKAAEPGTGQAPAEAPKAAAEAPNAAAEAPNAAAEAPKAEVSPAKTADPAPEEGAGGKPSEPPRNTNGVPEEPSRTHTPFVRIRRWFGTGSPN